MSDLIPGILARTRRGLCPTCGAGLPLEDQGRLVTCGYCGARSSLERRLRTVDADVDLPALEAGASAPADERALAAAMGESRPEPATCPGCGGTFHGDLAHEILACPFCGVQCKVERRMVRPDPGPRLPPQRRTREDFERQRRGDTTLPWDVQTEQLCWRVLNESDLEKRAAYALRFEEWSFVNATALYFLPHLLALARESDLRLAGPLCGIVGRLLCQDDARLVAPTLETCEPFARDPGGPSALLHEIGLGNARGLKLLLDAADAAAREGAVEHAVHALWAAHAVIERNFDEHPVIARILLYRLLDLSPLPLGWVLTVVRSGEGGYVFKDPFAFLEFLDDCAFERPELVRFLAERPYAPEVASLEELRARLAFVDARLSKAARSAALTALTNLSEDAPEEVLEAAVAHLDPWLDDPDLVGAAVTQLRRAIKAGEGIAPPLVRLITRRGRALPEIVQREVHWKAPGSGLLDRSWIPPYYDGEPKVPEEPAVTRALEAYDAAIREAVDRRDEERDAARDFWDRARALEVHLFEES